MPERIGSAAARLCRFALRWAGTRCLLCGGAMAGQPGDSFCSGCQDGLWPRVSGFCPLCGEVFALEEEEISHCGVCRRWGRPWEGFGFHGVYRDPLRAAITSFKFQADFGYLRLLQKLLVQAFYRHLEPEGIDAIVPMPLHPSRLRQRGFNQSLELCRSLAGHLRAEMMPGALRRMRDTSPQSGLDRTERRRNLRGAMAADPDRVGSRRVLLVDDVYTTGITASTAARALRRAKAERVDLLVLARVPEG